MLDSFKLRTELGWRDTHLARRRASTTTIAWAERFERRSCQAAAALRAQALIAFEAAPMTSPARQSPPTRRRRAESARRRSLRGKVVEMSHKAQAAHLASSLSCCDVLAAAYWHVLISTRRSRPIPTRDRFILSKGHAAAALYATLAFKGFFPEAELDTYCKDGGRLAEHPPANLLPASRPRPARSATACRSACGMALSGRINKQRLPRLRLLSDGENNEGSVWEAAMFAAAQKLENVCASSSTTTSGRRPRAPTRR